MHPANDENRYNQLANQQIRINNKNKIREEIAPSIVADYTWSGEKIYGRGIQLKYSFNYPVIIESKYYGSHIFAFNQSQISQARRSMQAWADIANISYTEVSRDEDVNIVFFNFSKKSSLGGTGDFPHNSKFSVIYINSFFDFNNSPVNLNLGGYALTHEIGHTLGLKHTHGSETTPKDQQYTQQVSIMSYRSAQAPSADYGDYMPSTPQLYDIAAIQYLYGANMNTRTGDTVYGFNSNSERDFLSANSASNKLIFCVWDADGNDTFDFSGYSENQIINLHELSFSDVGGLRGNISIAADVVIENAIGGRGSDKLYGNDADNILTGGAGADQLWGGQGRDIFRYSDINDSTLNSADTIYDFESDLDKIDLSPLVHNGITLVNSFGTSPDQYIDTTRVTQFCSELSDMTYLMIDFNHTDSTDIVIKISGKHQLTTQNFIVSPQLTA